MAQMLWGSGALRLLRNGTECLVIISRSRHMDIIPVLQEMFSDTPDNGRISMATAVRKENGEETAM